MRERAKTGSDRRPETGRRAERIAIRHLRLAGWRILDRNWTTRFGEIDLVCLRGRTILFVEVKARASRGGPGPERPALAVDRRKQARLSRLADAWLAGWSGRPDVEWDEVRFDVLGIELGPGGTTIEHLVDAFRPEPGWRRGGAFSRRLR